MSTETVDPRITMAAARMRAEGFTPSEHYEAGYLLVMGSVEKNPDGSQRAVAWSDGETTTLSLYTSWQESDLQ